MTRRRFIPTLAAVAALAAGVVCPPATAATPVPGDPVGDDPSSFSQYSERVPTSRGPVTPGIAPGEPLFAPPALLSAIARRGGDDTAALSALVATTAYGAPDAGFANVPRGAPEEPSVVEGVASALASAAGIAVLALLALAVGAAVVARRPPERLRSLVTAR